MWNSTRVIDWLIGIAAALAAGLILAIGKMLRERMPYQTIGKRRYQTLKGTWKGVVTPQENQENFPENFEITFNFRPGWYRRVRATSVFTSFIKGRQSVENVYRGGFHDLNHLILHYQNRDRSVNAFGGVILQLSADRCRLEGKVIGFSSHSDRLFYSTIALSKTD
jgi:hypothetical protein